MKKITPSIREGITRSYEDQAALLVFEKQSNPYLNAVHSQVEQDVLRSQDVSWGKLIRFTVSKAERAGKTVHICSRCGLIICRDLNASMGIRTLGLRGIACGESTSGFGLCPK
jgi:hypothetical protein